VLRALLPPKEELTIFVRCSDTQLELYRSLLQHHMNICEAARGEGGESCKCKHLLGFHAWSQKVRVVGVCARAAPTPATLELSPLLLQRSISRLSCLCRLTSSSIELSSSSPPPALMHHLWQIVNHPDALLSNWLKSAAEVDKAKSNKDSGKRGELLSPQGAIDTGTACSQTPATIEQPKEPASSCKGVAPHHATDSAPRVDGGGQKELVKVQKELLKEMEHAQPEAGAQEDVIMLDDDSKDADGAGGAPAEDGAADDGFDDDEGPAGDGERGLGVGWADTVFGEGRYEAGDLSLSGKMVVLMEILKEAREKDQKTLVFSQYQTTLNCIQTFLKAHNAAARRQMFGHKTTCEIRYRCVCLVFWNPCAVSESGLARLVLPLGFGV